MRILHYFLGYPPYRTGGLTKYSFDLMQAQVKDNNIVTALYPGKISVVFHKIEIKKRKSIKGIINYELINPLPIPLDEGINICDAYMKSCDSNIYKLFLNTVKPDVIHIHTLMGLHREFIEVANQIGIRTVFTTHDYFGLCPKVTFYRYGKSCEDDNGCRDCIQCNSNALSIKKIIVMQSYLYKVLKNSIILKKLRKHHRENFFMNEILPYISESEDEIVILAKKYKMLREYYIGILSKVELIHFNSTVAERVYKRYFSPQNSEIMTVTHQNISDNRKMNNRKPAEKLRIVCLAPAKPFKGFNVLKAALDDLWNIGKQDFELKIFSPVPNPPFYMKVQEQGFEYAQLSSIFADADALIAPSVWYETFGFTVLEAISYGVPVIVSDHVGAQDIVGNGGIIIEAGSVESLKEAVMSLSKNRIEELQNNILRYNSIKLWEKFLKDNYALYIRCDL